MLTRITGAIVLLIVATVNGMAMDACDTVRVEGLNILGIKLGMGYADVQTAVGPGLKVKRPKNGQGSFFQNFIDQPAAGKLAGVRALFLRFYQDKVYQIEVFYEESGQQGTLVALTTRLSSDLNLSPDVWTIKNGRAAIACGTMSLNADNILNPHVELTDEAASSAFKAKTGGKKSK